MGPGTTEAPYTALEGEGFSEQNIRKSFIVKVLALLTCMLFITTTVVTVTTVSLNVQEFILNNWWLTAICVLVLVGVSIVLACSVKTRQSFPINYVLLCLMTFSQASLLSYIVSAFQTPSVLIAIATTCLGTGAVAGVAMSSQLDITRFGIHIIVALVVLVLVEFILFALMPSLRIVDRLIGGVAALVFSIYIAVDIQLLMGGEQFLLFPEDYIGAVITLHLDIVNVISTLYKLIGEYKDKRGKEFFS